MSFNQKISGIFPQDSIVPKNFDMSNKNARYDNIVMKRACGVPVIVLVKPLKILAKQNKLNSVRFYNLGMRVSLDDHQFLIHLLINSVKYN